MEFGGSEAVAMWAVEALKGRDYDLSLVTSNAIDLSALNSFYGTAVREEEVKVRQLPVPRMLSGIRGGAAVRGALVERSIRRVARQFDALFSAYNICDLGVPAIHLLDLSWDEELRGRFAPCPDGIEGLFHRVDSLRAAYLWLGRCISAPSGRDLFSGEDVLLANSRWVASLIEEKHHVRCGLLYPPVPDGFENTPFESRSDDFVCLGRISEEKRLERVFQVVGEVRARGHQVRLRVIGGFDASSYAQKIQKIARGLPWVLLEGSVSAQRKKEIMCSCRYAIHGAEGEAFGIAVAEMLKAGCVTFAPVEGGPAEILNHEALLYRNDEDAVTKVMAVLGDKLLREQLIGHLHRQADNFSTGVFMSRLREIVDSFIESKKERIASGDQMRGANASNGGDLIIRGG